MFMISTLLQQQPTGAMQTAPLVASRVNYTTARLQLRCPAGFHHIFNLWKKKKKKKSNRECKSFSSLGQKTPEAARLAKNFCFSKRGHGDGGAESREGKH